MMPALPLAEILNEVQDAFRNFEHELSPSDVKEFQLTRLEDVYKAVQVIEREREQQRRSTNLKRIETLLNKLRPLEDVLRTIRPEEPSSCYVWAPIKCMLQIADASEASFKSLLNAYAVLSSQLPSCHTPTEHDHVNRYDLSITAYVLIDILDFHGRLYQILRRGGWNILFDSAWQPFLCHLDHISQRLKQCEEVVGGKLDDEGWNTFRHEREKLLNQRACKQQEHDDLQLRSCITWLELGTQEQEQQSLFDRRADAREAGTCEWILTHAKFRSWLDPDHNPPFLWLKGKPGSGKTTLATFVMDRAKLPVGSLLLYYLCTRGLVETQADPCLFALRAMVAQILRKRPTLVSFVYETYVRKAELLSMRTMSTVLRSLLLCLPSSYIIFDGLDECEPEHQKLMLAKFDFLLLHRKEELPPRPEIKILICSQDTKGTPARLKRDPIIFLTKEDEHVSKDICTYTKNNIKMLYERFEAHAVDKVASDIVDKAKGMFLWVRLVLSVLLEQQSMHDLRTTVAHLPAGLLGIYVAIMKRLEHFLDDRARHRIRAIFSWLTFSRRPLKVWELCDALVFDERGRSLNKDTVLGEGILDACKPLVEQHSNGTVAFIHFSVQEFLLHQASGPFIEEWKAERAISIACFRYLRTCEAFFDKSRSPNSYVQIIQCLHALFPYVNEFWEAHLTACLASIPPEEEQQHSREYGDVVVHNGALIQGDQYFINLAGQAQLADRSDWGLEALGLSNGITQVTEIQTSRPPSLLWLFEQVFDNKSGSQKRAGKCIEKPSRMPYTALLNIPQVSGLACLDEPLVEHQQAIPMRQMAACEQIIETAEMAWAPPRQKPDAGPLPKASSDPISKAYSHFQELLEDVIGDRLPFSWEDMDVSEEEARAFRMRYATSAYMCMWKGCPRSSLGFRSSAERSKHEVFHTQQFCCPEVGCDFAENGFASHASLKGHIKKYHSQAVEIPIPQLQLRNSQLANWPRIRSKLLDVHQQRSQQHRRTPSEHYVDVSIERRLPSKADSALQKQQEVDEPRERPQPQSLPDTHTQQQKTPACKQPLPATAQLSSEHVLQVIYKHLSNSRTSGVGSNAWSTMIPVQERAGRVQQLFSSLRLLNMSVTVQRLLEVSLLFEAKQFKECATQQAYEQSFVEKLEHIDDKRKQEQAQRKSPREQLQVDVKLPVEPALRDVHFPGFQNARAKPSDEVQTAEQVFTERLSDFQLQNDKLGEPSSDSSSTPRGPRIDPSNWGQAAAAADPDRMQAPGSNSVRSNDARRSWTNLGTIQKQLQQEQEEAFSRFYDHFEAAAEELLDSGTQSSECLQFLTESWQCLNPERRNLLLRVSNFEEGLMHTGSGGLLEGAILTSQAYVLVVGLETYIWFCNQLRPIMLREPDLWHDKIEENSSKIWRRLQKEQRRCIHLAKLSGAISVRPTLVDRTINHLFDRTMSEIKILAAGLDPKFSNMSFYQRFELRKLFSYGLDAPALNLPALQNQCEDDSSRNRLHELLKGGVMPYGYGEKTRARLINIVWELLESEERLLVSEKFRADSDVFTNISANSLLNTLEVGLRGWMLDYVKKLENEESSFQLFSHWLRPQLESVTSDQGGPRIANQMQKWAEEEWKMLSSNWKSIFGQLAPSYPSVKAAHTAPDNG